MQLPYNEREIIAYYNDLSSQICFQRQINNYAEHFLGLKCWCFQGFTPQIAYWII